MGLTHVDDFAYLNKAYLQPDGRWKQISPSFCNYLGYTEDELLSQILSDILHPNDQLKSQELLSVQEGQTIIDLRFLRKDGEIRWANVKACAIGDDSDGSASIAIYVTDITPYKDSQQKLIESEQRWHRLIEYNPLPVLISVGGIIKFINKTGLKIYGVENEEEILGKSVFDFIHAESTKKVRNRIKDLEQEKRVPPSEQRIIKSNGEELYVEVHSIPIKYKGKEAVQTVLRDITETKKREDKIISALEEKEILLQEIHHRVKNNLAVISGLLELQAMSSEDETVRKVIRESQLQIQSMAMIHEKLYNSSSLSDIEFDKYARELVETIIESHNMEQQDITVNYDMDSITLNIAKVIPSALILNELVSNCYKHAFADMDEGRIDIGIKRSNGEISISVTDNGQGIPDGFSVENQDTLGMQLIQTLSLQLDGEVNYKSGNGATFILRFPVCE